jgi:hypothetical protein
VSLDVENNGIEIMAGAEKGESESEGSRSRVMPIRAMLSCGK